MMKKLISLDDDVLVQIDILPGQVEQISGDLISKVSSGLSIIEPVILKVYEPIKTVLNNQDENSKIKEVEVEFGFSFEAEGNIFITSSKASANLIIKLRVGR